MNKQEITQSFYTVLKGKVKFALFFGSILTERFTESSDVDCAAFFDPVPDLEEELQIRSTLTELTKRELDLIVLNTSDIIISMQALANGRLIIDNDHGSFVVFKAQKMSEYIDFKQDRKIIEDAMLKGRKYV